MGNVFSSSVEDVIRSGNRDKITRRLYYRAYDGDVKSVKILLEAKADVHYSDDLPLRSAVLHGHKEVVKLLLEHGAYPDVKDQYCIREASGMCYYGIVNLLLQYGGDISRLHRAYIIRYMSPRHWTYLRKLERIYGSGCIPEYRKYRQALQRAVIEITRVYGRILGLIIFDYI